MAILKIKQPNGSWAIVGDTSETIKFTKQQLTEEQKKVARENIGASSQYEAKTIIHVDILPTDNIEDKFYVKTPKATLGYKYADGSFNPEGHTVDCSVMKDFLDPAEALPGYDTDTGRWHMYYCMVDKNVYVNITEQIKSGTGNSIVADCPLGWQLVNDFGRNGKYVTSSTSIFYLQGVAHSIEEMVAPVAGMYYYILLEEENSDLLYNVHGDWKTVVTQDKALQVEISETPKDGEILVYDATTNKLVNSGFTFETLFDKIHKMIDDYMNTSITVEENDAGGVTQSVEAPANAISTSANEAGGETLNIGG